MILIEYIANYDLITELANEYYILKLSFLYLCANYEIVESEATVRRRTPENKFVAKTRDGLVDVPFMSAHTKYTHEEMLIEMDKPPWNEEI